MLLAGTASAQPASPPSTIMTWNVNTLYHSSSEWVEQVRLMRPDVLAVQEICVRDARIFQANLRDVGLDYNLTLGSVSKKRHPGCNALSAGLEGAFGQAVLSRLPVRDPENVSYPRVGDEERRGYMAVTVQGRSGEFRLFNTHLGLGGQPDQLRRLAAAVGRHPRAVVVGDFNVQPDSAELDPLRAVAADADAGDSPVDVTFPEANWKVDYIFLRGLAVAPGSVSQSVDSHNRSDHRPLIAPIQ